MLENENASTTLWRCPVCNAPLEFRTSYHCSNGHNFDLAREGYVNLLLPQHKRSAHPGDSKAMLRHRRDFLNKCHYQPLAASLSDACRELLTGKNNLSFLDTGCGEGYYTHYLTSALRAQLGWSGGIDIAKEAIRMAAKAYPDCHFAVASSARIPLMDSSLDILTRIFAPGNTAEVARCLRPDGIMLAVTPGPEHLFQLRSLIYDHPVRHDHQQETISGLKHLRSNTLQYTLELNDAQDIANLFSMTPYFWQVDQTKQAQILSLQELTTIVDFTIAIYRKDN